jgi:AcrR family transcriptional regulator
MVRSRFENLAPEKRKRLLVAAANEFASHGFEGASLNRILDSAGLSKGALYYYFDDKADLFATVVEQAWASLLPVVGFEVAELDAATFWSRLSDQYMRLLERASVEPWLVASGKSIYSLPAAERERGVVGEQFQRARRWLLDLVRRGQTVGAVRTDLPEDLLVALAIGASEAADRWMVEHWEAVDPRDAKPVALRLFDAIRRLLEPHPGGAR